MSTLAATDTRPLRHWLNGAGKPHLVICCAEHPASREWSRAVVSSGPTQAVVRLVTCVGELAPAVLLELVAGGASGITVALDGCANPAGAEAVVAKADAFLSALPGPQTIRCAPVVPSRRRRGAPWPILNATAMPLSRRALLGRADDLNLVEPSGHPMQRLVAVLRELVVRTGTGTELDGIPTGVPRLTVSGCAGSGVCARACPADALTVTSDVLAEANESWEQIAQFQLIFDPVRCTDCGKCLQVCPESAIERAGQYLWSSLLRQERVNLRVGLTRRCARCGGPHGQLGDLCAVCAFRTENPFGSMLPPGAPARASAALAGL